MNKSTPQTADMQKRLKDFSAHFLKSQAIPQDLQQMLLMQWTRVKSEEDYADPLEALRGRFFDIGDSHPLLDNSYLNENDRANPDIMANVRAIGDIVGMSSFIGEDDDGGVFGYWHGPEQIDAGKAALIRLDTEGQFSLYQGHTLADALVSSWIFDEDDFKQIKTWLANFDITISADNLDDFPEPQSPSQPDDMHHDLYEKYLAAPV